MLFIQGQAIRDPLAWRRARPWPLLEREHEFGALSEAMESASGGRGRLLFVVGEAGIGKTALVRQFAAAHPQCRTLTGACEPLDTPEALGPLFDIAPGLGPDVPDRLAGGSSRAELFASVLAALQTGAKPSLLVFEDVQWADQTTLDLLRYLGRRAERLPAVVVATLREEDAGPGSPLAIVLGDLATAPGVERIALAPLSEHATGILASGTGINVQELHGRTGGNPFFITEVLAAGGASVPATVRDAVLARVARLAEPTRQAVEAAAAIGPRFVPELFASVLDAICLPRWTMRAAVFTGLLREDRAELVFRHSLAQSAIADALAGDRLQWLHGIILAILQRTSPGPDGYAALVFQAEGAGDDDAVTRYAPLAAARAATLCAHRESAALYGKALRAARGQPAGWRAEHVELQAGQLSLSGDLASALSGYRSAAGLWREEGNRLGVGRTLTRVAALSFLAGRYEEAQAAEAEALRCLEARPPSRELASAYENRGRRLFMAMDPSGAEHWALRARGVAEELGDMETALDARVGAAAARLLAGNETARLELVECLGSARAQGLEELVARVTLYLGWLPILRRDYTDVEAYLSDARAYAEEHELEYWRLLVAGARVRYCLDQGRWGEMEEIARCILAHPDPVSLPKITALVAAGRLRARRGEADAFRYLDEAGELALAYHRLEAVAAALPARAEAAWLAGDWEAARQEARSAISGGIGVHNPWWVGELACWLRRAGANPGCSHPVAEPYALELAGDWQSAAGWWERRGCRYEAALALSFAEDPAAVTTAISAFDSLGAAPAAAWARGRLRSLGVATVPRGPRPSTTANPARLTQREQDVLGLVADGLTNVQIGNRLFLSHKTVERHLSGILRKLSVTTRSEAIRYARRIGALPSPQDGGSSLPN